MNVNPHILRTGPYSSLAPGAEEDDSTVESLVSSVATSAMAAATPAAASSARAVIPRDFSAGCRLPFPCLEEDDGVVEYLVSLGKALRMAEATPAAASSARAVIPHDFSAGCRLPFPCVGEGSPVPWRLTFYTSSVMLDPYHTGGGFIGSLTYSKANLFNPVSIEGDHIVVLTSGDTLRIRPIESDRDKFNVLYSWLSAWYGVGESSVRAASSAACNAEPLRANTRAVAPSSSAMTALVPRSFVSAVPTVSSSSGSLAPIPVAGSPQNPPQNRPWVLPIDVLVDLNPLIHRIRFDTQGHLVVMVMNHSLLSPQVFTYDRDPALCPVEEIGNNAIKITLANRMILKIRPASQSIKYSDNFVRAFKQFATYDGPVEELPKKVHEAWSG